MNCDLSPQTCLERIWQHLSIPSRTGHHSAGHATTANYDSAMAPACRERLRKIFWQEIGQLEHLLGWDCSDWLRC